MPKTPETPALPGDLTDYQHELVLNALDRLANQAIAAAGATVLVPRKPDSYQALRDASAGDAELVRAALEAAARVAPVTPSEPDDLVAHFRVCDCHDSWDQCPCAEGGHPADGSCGCCPRGTGICGPKPAPSPDREKLIATAEAWLASPTATMEGGRGAVRKTLAALAVPPAPSPDSEKPEVFDALRDLLGASIYPSIIDTGRGDINDAQAATTELAEAVLALFAVPPVVNKAKLAEVFGEALPSDCAVTSWQARQLAAAARERQREWLE